MLARRAAYRHKACRWRGRLVGGGTLLHALEDALAGLEKRLEGRRMVIAVPPANMAEISPEQLREATMAGMDEIIAQYGG